MYNRRTEHQLIWKETREDVALALRQISQRIQNEVLSDLDKKFNAAVTAGKKVSFEFTKSEIHQLFATATGKVNKSLKIGG